MRCGPDLTLWRATLGPALAGSFIGLAAFVHSAAAQDAPFSTGFQNRFGEAPTPVFTRPENRLGVLPRAGSPGLAPEPSLLDPTPIGSPDDPASVLKPGPQDGPPSSPETGAGAEVKPRGPSSATSSDSPSRAARRSPASEKPIGRGIAAWYEHPGRTANGERYRPDGLTAAHRTLPFGTRVRVTHQRTGRSVVVRINDRAAGPRRIAIDLSRGAARRLGIEGLAPVTMSVVFLPEAAETPVAQIGR